jgi:hypothetical protein
LFVLPASLGTIDALFGGQITDRLKKSAFAYLASGEVMYTVLEGINLLDAGHFGLVECVYFTLVSL